MFTTFKYLSRGSILEIVTSGVMFDGSYAREIMLPFLDLICLSLLLTSHVPGRSSPYLADTSVR